MEIKDPAIYGKYFIYLVALDTEEWTTLLVM